MSIKGKAYIVGIYEHPTRLAQDKTVPQLHAECALGALQDAGATTSNDADIVKIGAPCWMAATRRAVNECPSLLRSTS